jgi:N-acetylmuramoyl-L-alanine amidase
VTDALLEGAGVTDAPLSRPIDLLVIHHSASPRETTLEQIDAWHRERGMDGIGYHHVIGADGALRAGRPLARAGAHAAGHNAYSIGLCVTGDNTREDRAWSGVQREALAHYVRWFRTFFPEARVLGHRDCAEARTLCPGLVVDRLLDEPGP